MRVVILSTMLLAFGVGCAAEVSEPLEQSVDTLGARQLRYTQVNISAAPAGYDSWFPRGLSEDGEVIGQATDCNEDFSVCQQDVVKRNHNGRFTVLEGDFLVNDLNSRGDAGGCTFDPVTFLGQAGIVHENGRLELIPPQPGEMSSCVSRVSDAGVAFVTSTDPEFVNSVYIYDRGRRHPFPVMNVSVEDINDSAQLTGTQFDFSNRAYRFDARTQTTTLLDPVPPNPQSWGYAINRQGEVLGTSFDFDGSVQRIGKWSRRKQFQTYLVATPGFIANSLTWNEHGLIVVSAASDQNTYLVPSPGVWLNLANLVRNQPAATSLSAIAVNQRGDIVASSSADGSAYLYRRN